MSAAATSTHAIVTGGNSGIGKATALELAKKGLSVTLACRHQESADEAAAEIASTTGTNVRSMHCDLASLCSVRRFAQAYRSTELPLHVLVNNAGVMACPLEYTEDGFEKHLAVNHLGHFVLTLSLFDLLCSSASQRKRPSRVVILASAAERLGGLDLNDLNFKHRAYNRWLAYGQSKLANCLFSLELSRLCSEQKFPVTSNSMHPGIVDTKLPRYILPEAIASTSSTLQGAFLRKLLRRLTGIRSPEQGASTAIYLACSKELEVPVPVSGKYFENCCIASPSSKAVHPGLARALWQASENLTGSKFLDF